MFPILLLLLGILISIIVILIISLIEGVLLFHWVKLNCEVGKLVILELCPRMLCHDMRHSCAECERWLLGLLGFFLTFFDLLLLFRGKVIPKVRFLLFYANRCHYVFNDYEGSVPLLSSLQAAHGRLQVLPSFNPNAT